MVRKAIPFTHLIFHVFIFLIALFYWGELKAQRFGGNSPSLKFNQINTDTVRVIFPAGMEKEGARVADIARYLSRTTTHTIGEKRKKINIVLQNQTTITNGYVGLAPWRSEFYLTPQQNSLNLGSLPWVDNLAIHEYRHVQQYMNFRKGLSTVAYIIAGEEGQTVANAAAIPDWFFEGDAVFQETLVSEQGRGRLPEFFNGYRAIWEAGKQYSYMKLRNGSYRHYVPDHYQLGYQLVAYGREKYGEEFWKNVTNDAVRFKPLIYPFQGALKKYAGVSFSEYVKNATEYFKNEKDTSEYNAGRSVTAQYAKYVVDYQYPYDLGDGSVLVLKKSYREIPAWYIIDKSGEKKVAQKDVGIDDYYSYRNGKIVYTAYQTDARWSWKDYSQIYILDIEKKQRTQITRHTKYFSPELSHDEVKIVAVSVSPGGQSSLHILNSTTGKVLKAFPNPEHFFYTYPRFTSDDKSVVVAVRNSVGQMAMQEVDVQTGEVKVLLPFANRVIAYTYLKDDMIVFTSAFKGRDEVMMLKGGELYRMVSQYAGSYQASVSSNSDSLWYSRFTAGGMQLFKTSNQSTGKLNPESWAQADNELYTKEALEQSGRDILKQVESHDYKIDRYKSVPHLFNFHSWRPYYDPPNWSFSLYSDNVMNTFSQQLYYEYNENENTSKVGYDGAFSAWYPWIVAGGSYTFDRELKVADQQLIWDELEAYAGLQVPLNFSKGRYYKFLTARSTAHTERIFVKKGLRAYFGDETFNYLENSLRWSIQSQQAAQHILPRFANNIFLQHRYLLGDVNSWQFLGSTSIYLPGLAVNHNLVFKAAYQARDTSATFIFDNDFPFSRGYPEVDAPRMWKVAGEYHFPIFYPDWGFAQMLYFLRVRADVFYDYTWVKSLRTGNTTPLRSFGTEIFFDTKIWNQQPISFGFRYSRMLDVDAYVHPPDPNKWEFILPVNLIR